MTLTGEVFDRNYNENTLSSINSTYSRYHTLEETKRSRVSAGYDYKAANPVAFISEAHLTAYWQNVDTIDQCFGQSNFREPGAAGHSALGEGLTDYVPKQFCTAGMDIRIENGNRKRYEQPAAQLPGTQAGIHGRVLAGAQEAT